MENCLVVRKKNYVKLRSKVTRLIALASSIIFPWTEPALIG